MEAPSFKYKPKARKSKILLKYSCEEIEERMANGFCIFCEEQDTPGHHDLKHKGVKIFMMESDNQPVVTESDYKPMLEESLVGSDLQVVDAAAPTEAQNKSVAEENMSFSLGNKIEHMVGKHTQKADRIWEPGGFLVEPDRQTLQTEAVLHGHVLFSGPEELKNDRLPSCAGGFEIYGLKLRRQMVTLINQGPKVEEMLVVKVDQVCLHFKELEVLPEKITSSNDANVSKRLCEQVPIRVMSTEKHGKYLRAWKFKFKSKNLVGACANKKRPLDPGITKIFKPLVCFGAQNKECEAELEIYMHHGSKPQKLCVMYHCSEMEFSVFKKLHEMGSQRNPELVSSLVKDTQDQIVKACFKTRACSCFDRASWSGLEVFGCKYKKHMSPLAKESYRVWERGGVLGTHVFWKLLTESSISLPQISNAITITDENILVNKLCYQGYSLLMFLVQDHITEAWFSHFLACGILLVSCSDLQSLLVSYSRRCHGMIYLDSSEESVGFVITRRWLSVVHLLCSMGISLLTAVLWNRKTRKKENESRLSWDALLVRYNELKPFTEKIYEDLIQAGYEWLISNYSCHKANTVKELAATDARVRLLWETIMDVTVALFSGCGITKDFTEYINWSKQGMQDHTDFNQFLFDTEVFQVKHKWRYKPFPIVSELELKDETALGNRNEDMLSCYITGQARDVVVSLHVEVRRTIEMSQVLLVVTNCYGDLSSYGEAFYISFQCYKIVQVMVQEDRNSLKEVKAHKKAVTRCLVQWKEHPPDQVLMLSSLRTRMF